MGGRRAAPGDRHWGVDRGAAAAFADVPADCGGDQARFSGAGVLPGAADGERREGIFHFEVPHDVRRECGRWGEERQRLEDHGAGRPAHHTDWPVAEEHQDQRAAAAVERADGGHESGGTAAGRPGYREDVAGGISADPAIGATGGHLTGDDHLSRRGDAALDERPDGGLSQGDHADEDAAGQAVYPQPERHHRPGRVILDGDRIGAEDEPALRAAALSVLGADLAHLPPLRHVVQRGHGDRVHRGGHLWGDVAPAGSAGRRLGDCSTLRGGDQLLIQLHELDLWDEPSGVESSTGQLRVHIGDIDGAGHAGVADRGRSERVRAAATHAGDHHVGGAGAGGICRRKVP